MTLTLDHALFDAAPKGLRAELTDLDPAAFLDRYTRADGSIALREWSCSGTDFTATLEFDEQSSKRTTTKNKQTRR